MVAEIIPFPGDAALTAKNIDVEPMANQTQSGDGGGLDSRVAKLEAAVEHIQSDVGEIKGDLRQIRQDMRGDFRWTWAGMATMFVLLAGLAITGYLRLDDRLLSINNNISDLAISVAPKGGASSP